MVLNGYFMTSATAVLIGLYPRKVETTECWVLGGLCKMRECGIEYV